MLRKITLHGPLAATYGEQTIELDADDFPTLLRGLDCAYPNFLIELRKHPQMAVALKKGEDVSFITPENMGWSFGSKDEILVTTSEQGSGAEIAAAVASWASGASSFAAATGWSAFVYAAAYVATTIAIAYAVGRIAQSLADTPESDGASADERRSALFDQAVNLQGQGHPVPLLYGRFKCGSVVISAGVRTTKNAIAFGDAIVVEYLSTVTGNLFSNDIDGSTLTLQSWTLNGVSRTPGQTYTTTGLSFTLNSNGSFTAVSDGAAYTNVTGTYTATSSSGNTTDTTFKVEVVEKPSDYNNPY